MLRHFVDALVAWGPLGILALAILDSVIPIAGAFDILIAVFAAERPDLGWWCAACAVIGSTAGTYFLFDTARRGGRRFLNQETASERSRKFRAWFERYGLITVFIPALLPIPMPLKVFVVSAGALGTQPRSFLLVLVLSRTLRYFSIAWLGVSLGQGAGPFLLSHAWAFLLAALALFVILYGAVKLNDRRRARA